MWIGMNRVNQRMNMDLIKSTKDVKLGRNTFGHSQRPSLLNQSSQDFNKERIGLKSQQYHK